MRGSSTAVALTTSVVVPPPTTIAEAPPKRKKGVCTDMNLSASDHGSEYYELARQLAGVNAIVLAMKDDPQQAGTAEFRDWLAERRDLKQRMANHRFHAHAESCAVCKFIIGTIVLHDVDLDAAN